MTIYVDAVDGDGQATIRHPWERCGYQGPAPAEALSIDPADPGWLRVACPGCASESLYPVTGGAGDPETIRRLAVRTLHRAPGRRTLEQAEAAVDERAAALAGPDRRPGRDDEG